MQGFLTRKTFKNYLELLAKERSQTERLFILKVLARTKAEDAAALCEDGRSLKAKQETIACPDLELLRLEDVLRLARDLVGGILPASS